MFDGFFVSVSGKKYVEMHPVSLLPQNARDRKRLNDRTFLPLPHYNRLASVRLESDPLPFFIRRMTIYRKTHW